MLSDFLKKVKPKEYSIQVLSDTTSKAAAKRVKHNRFSSFMKTAVSLGVVVAAVGGGVVSAGAATAVTSSNAKADILTDLICIDGNSDDAGKWDAGSNRYANMGGQSTMTMEKITASTKSSNVAVFGFPEDSWGPNERYVTAYEKYGLEFPKFDSWKPVYADEEYTFKGVSAAGNGTYSDGGTIPTSSLATAVAVQPGASKLTTTNALSCTAILPSVESGIANILTTPSRFITAIALEIYGASFGTSISQEGSILYPIGQAIDAMITNQGGLRDTLFVPFMIPLITMGAMWVAYVGIVKRRAAAAVQSVVWMVAAIAAGTVFLAQPTLISGFIDSGVAEVQQVINETVLTTENDMCLLNGTADTNSVTREMKCSIWYSTIYAPWVSGQFGTSITSKESADPNRDGGDVLTSDPRGFLKTQAAKISYGSSNSNVTPATWAQFMLDRQATTKSFEISEVAYAQLSGQAAMGVNGTWAGGTGNQISAAILMFFGVLASTLVLFVYGFALLIYQLLMVTAVLLSPLFFLMGIIPNWGRRVLMRYAEILVSLALKRIITSLLLAIYLIFYQLVSGTGPLFIQLILVAVLAVFAVFARTRFVNMFAGDINFGGNKSINLPGAGLIAGAAGLGGAAAGLAVAGPIGALVGGANAHKNAKQDAAGIAGSNQGMTLSSNESAPTADVRTPRGGGGPNGTPPTSSTQPSIAKKAGRVAGKGLKATETVAGMAALVPGVGTATALAVGTAAGVAGKVVTAASGADGVAAAGKAAAGVGAGVAMGAAKGKLSRSNDARDAAKATAKAKQGAAVVNTEAPTQQASPQQTSNQGGQKATPTVVGATNTQNDSARNGRAAAPAAAVVNTQKPQQQEQSGSQTPQNAPGGAQGNPATQNVNSGRNTSQGGNQGSTAQGAAVVNTQRPQQNTASANSANPGSTPTRPAGPNQVASKSTAPAGPTPSPFGSSTQPARPAAAVVNTKPTNTDTAAGSSGGNSSASKATPQQGQQVITHEPERTSGSTSQPARPAAATVKAQKASPQSNSGSYPGNKPQETKPSQPAAQGTPVSRPAAPTPAPRSNQTTPQPTATPSGNASASPRPAQPTQPAAAPKQQFPGQKPKTEKPKPINNTGTATPPASREVGPGAATIPVNHDKKDNDK